MPSKSVGSSHISSRITRRVSEGKNEGLQGIPEGHDQQQPALQQVKIPRAETLRVTTQDASLLAQGQETEGADNHRAGEQGRPARQNIMGVTDHESTGLPKDSLEREAMMRIREIKGM